MSGVSRVAIRGTPQTATPTREAVATRLQTITLVRMRRSPRPLRSTGSDRSSIASAKLPVANLEPCEHRAAGLAEAEHALGRGHGLELVVRPLGEHGSVGGTNSQHVGRELDRHGVPRAGRAVEEGAWARSRHDALRSRPRSARRRGLRRPARPAARRRVTCSSTARLEMSRDSTTHRQSPSLTVA